MGIDTKSNTFCKIAHVQGKKSQENGNLPKKSPILRYRPQYSENLSFELNNNALIEFPDPINMGIDTKSNNFRKIAHVQKISPKKSVFFTEKVSYFEL